jgi:PAS domain S-box-containing protein
MGRRDLQAEFFASMAEPQAFRLLFEHLPGVFFFVKDAGGRMIAASSPILERLGLSREREIVGKTDDEFFPAEIAAAFRSDDQQVLRSRKPLVNRLEVWYDEQRVLDWFLTTKVPVNGKNGRPIGIMGVTRPYEERMASYTVREVAAVVGFLRENRDRKMSVAELAEAVGVSERDLHRKVRDALGTTPHDLMLRMRVQGAAEALARTGSSIEKIATDHGFCDQSAFTQQFRRRTGMTPREFRKRHQH